MKPEQQQAVAGIIQREFLQMYLQDVIPFVNHTLMSLCGGNEIHVHYIPGTILAVTLHLVVGYPVQFGRY